MDCLVLVSVAYWTYVLVPLMLLLLVLGMLGRCGSLLHKTRPFSDVYHCTRYTLMLQAAAQVAASADVRSEEDDEPHWSKSGWHHAWV